MQPQTDTIEPSNTARLVLFIYVLVLASGLYFFMQSLETIKPLLESTGEQLQVAILYINSLFNYLLLFTIVQAMLLSWLFIRIAYKAKQQGQFPPDGTWVIVKTRIQSGKQANKPIWFCYISAVIVWLPVGLPIYLMWLVDRVLGV